MKKLMMCVIVVMLGLVFGAVSNLHAAIPGSGTADISPSTAVVAGELNEWRITYTCEDPFTNGILKFIIPAGWTPPQNTASTSPGYFVVDGDDPMSTPVVTVAGQEVTVTINNLGNQKHFWLDYGFTDGGANPGARAQAQTVPDSNVVFTVQSDPKADGSLEEITSSPTLSVVAGPVAQLVFTSAPFIFSTTGEAGPFTVKARDEFGNPQVVGAIQPIALSTTSSGGEFSQLGGGSFSPVTSVDMELGTDSVTFYYRDTVAGTPTLTAHASGQTWTDATQQQTVEPGPPHELAVYPADATVTAGDFTTLTIAVLDEHGNRSPVPAGRTVTLSSAPSGTFYTTSDHVTPITSTAISAGEESTQVDYWNINANGGAPHTIIVFSSASPSLLGSTGITILPAALSTSASTITADSPVTADGTTTSVVVVTVTDQYGNPLGGIAVDLTVTGSAAETDPAPTLPDGTASGAVTNTVAELVTVTATAGGQLLVDDAQILFEAGLVDADISELAATSPIVADGVTASGITVTARDAQGNPVGGATVILSASPEETGDLLTPAVAITNSSGVASGELRGVVAGTRTVSAQVDGVPLTATAPVELTAGSATSFVWVHDGNAVAGVNENVSLEVRDGQGNRVTGYTGTVLLDTDTGGGTVVWGLGAGAGGTLGPQTGDQAEYTFVASDSGFVNLLVSDTRAETIILSATENGASGSSAGLMVVPGPADQLILVSGNGQSAEAGTEVTSPLVVRVEDSYGNVVSGEAVTFTVLTGEGTIDVVTGGGTDSVATSDGSGEAECEDWVLGTSAGGNSVRAHMASGSVPSVDFTATGSVGIGVDVALFPLVQNVTINEVQEVTATLEDQYGNPVPGEQVTILIKSPPNGTLEASGYPTTPISSTARYGITDGSGQISVHYRAPSGAGLVDSVDAFGDGATQEAVTDAVYTSVSEGATRLRIVWESASTAKAGETFSFRVQAVDNSDNVDTSNSSLVDLTGEAGGGLQFSESDFGSVVSQVILVAGEKIVYGQGTTVGTWDITASDNGGLLGLAVEEVEIEDTGVIDHYVVSTVDSVDAGASFSVNISARDEFGNLVVGAGNQIDLVAVEGLDSLTVTGVPLLVASTTLSSGQAVVGESYTAAGLIRVRVRDAGLNEGYSGLLKVKPADAYQVLAVSADTTGVVAGNSVPFIATVQDIHGNDVPGVPVYFLVTAGGGGVTPLSADTGPTGRVSVLLTTGSVAGENRLRARIDDGVPSNLETAEFVVQTIASGIAYFTVVPDKYALTAGETTNVTVSAYDIFDNLVTGDNTTSVALGSTTGNAQYGLTPGTLTGGVYTTTVWDETAETVQLTALSGGANGTSLPLTVSNAGGYRITKVSSDTTGVVVGSRTRLWVEVTDQYDNVVPDYSVVFAKISDPDGTAYLRDAVPDTTDGLTKTGANGRAWIDLQTALTAGDNQVRASILDGDPPDRETKLFTVTTTAGAIDHYQVTASTQTETAGVPVGITVKAYDSNNNLVPDDTTPVLLSMQQGSGVFAPPNPAVLQAGTLSTTVTSTIAQIIQVKAETNGGGPTGLGPAITIIPDLPSGTITVSATRDTITANGTSTTTLTSGTIQDQFGNTVTEGSAISVSTTRGMLSQSTLLTNTLGVVSVNLQSGTTPGTALVSLSSDAGSAVGGTNIYFAQPPAFLYQNYLSPAVVVPGDPDSVVFRITIQNTSSTGVYLTAATSFEFNDGATFFTAPLGSPLYLAAAATDTLTFARTFVSETMTPGTYQPVVHLRGTDQYGESFDKATTLPSNSLLVSAIEVVSISAPSVVSRGQTVPVVVGITNKGSEDAIITDVSLAFEPAGSYGVPSSSDLPVTVSYNQTEYVTFQVDVGSTAPGDYTLDASAGGTVAGIPVSDGSLAPYALPSWTVQLAADISYLAGTLAPQVVSHNQTHGFSAQVNNAGSAPVILDAAGSNLFFHDGPDTFRVNLTQSVAVAGGSTQLLEFNDGVIPVAIDGGRSYDVFLHLAGTENGSPFTADLQTSSGSDSVLVVTPAQADYILSSLSPRRVSKETSVAFTARFNNSGGGTIIFNADSTRFSFDGGAYSAPLNTAFTAALAPGDTTLTFSSRTIGAGIANGFYFPRIRLVGTENGISFTKTVTLTDTLFVEEPPQVSIAAIRPSQPSITADQAREIDLWMRVVNSGQAAVELDSVRVRLFLSSVDRTIEFTLTNPAVFHQAQTTLLAGGGEDSLRFTLGDNIANSMSTGAFTIEGNLWVTDQNNQQQIALNTDQGGKGSLVVQSAANVVIQSIIPSQSEVTVEQERLFQIRMAVRNSGGSDVEVDLTPGPASLIFDQGNNWDWVPRPQLASGLTVLAEGVTDTVIFDVSRAGNVAAVTRIDGIFTTTEINSGEERAFQTSGGLGTITVQTPPDIVFNSVTPVVPNAPLVNTGQRFPVAVALHNNGQATAEAVRFRLDPSSGSTVEPPDEIAGAVIDGGQTVIDTFWVVADATLGNDTLLVTLLEAIDVNSLDTTTVFGPHPQDRTVITKQAPAQFVFTSAAPSQASVTRQQTTPWYITLHIENRGDADLQLAPPAEEDLDFYLGAVLQTDYLITPPAGFLSGRGGWMLPGNDADSLRFTVDVTGSAVGEVRFEAALSATDRNDASLHPVQKDSTVTVQSPAGLYIDDLSAVAPNTPQPGLAYVNTGQTFELVATVKNSGEDLRDVQVTLSTDGASTIQIPASALQTIDKDSTATFNFTIDAALLPDIQEIFTAVINQAISVNTGQPVTPQPPADNTERIVIETPADLVTEVWISDRYRAANDTVSTEQVFSVFAVVDNRGGADIDNSGTFAITLPPGFLLDPASQADTLAFADEWTRSWQVRAPLVPTLDQQIRVDLAALPLDVNAGAPAAVSIGVDSVTVDVLEQAAFISTTATIVAPLGATDNTVSSEQEFTLRGTVIAEPTATDIRATIVLPPGFSIDPGDEEVLIGDGTGAEQYADFVVTAPAGPLPPSNLRIDFTGVDENTLESITGSATRVVTVVLKAMLSLSVEIVGPAEATDSTVTPGLQFTVGATVSNGAGRADVDTTTGPRPRIYLTDYSGYQLTSPGVQAFTVGQRVEWNLTAPAAPVGPVAIRFVISSLPLDENSGAVAAVAGAQERAIPVQMEAERVVIDNVTAAVGFETVTRPVDQGRQDIGVLAMEIYNPSENDNTVQLEWIDVTVLDRHDNPIAEPERVFSELVIQTQAGETYSGALTANPVRVDFGSAVTLTPADFDTFSVFVSIAGNAPEGEFSISIEDTSDIHIFDLLSSVNMPIVDKGTQQGDIHGRYRSRGLVIGSGSFGEYVRNYPNPFGAGREVTRIAYFLDSPGNVSIKIYSLRGELVYEQAFNGGEPETLAGAHEIIWDGRNMNGDVIRNGIYICQIQAGGNSAKIKIAVAK